MTPGLKKAVPKLSKPTRSEVWRSQPIKLERILRRGKNAGKIKADAIFESICKYAEEKHSETLRRVDPAISVEDLVQGEFLRFFKSGKPISNIAFPSTMRGQIDLAVNRIIKKTPKIVSRESLSIDIKRDVRNQKRRFTGKLPEELLVEALLRRGVEASFFESHQQTKQRRNEIQKAVNTALKTLTPQQKHVLWEHAVNGKSYLKICDSKKYKELTKKGYTSKSRVGKIYLTAKAKFIDSIEKQGILERAK